MRFGPFLQLRRRCQSKALPGVSIATDGVDARVFVLKGELTAWK